MRAALYCRVSTSDQRDEGTSLDTQRDQGLVKAGELGWTVPQEYIIQEDWTGTDLQRPGLLRLLDLARSGRVQGIIIYTLDRLYRPENDGDEWRVFEVLQQFQDVGVQVAWVDASMPARGPLSSIFTFLDAWRAGRERRAILERTTRGRLEKARRGKVISRTAAPYGYRYDPATSTLVIDEEEAKTVRMVFYLYTQERFSLIKLVDRLNRLGIPRPSNGRRWHISFVAGMLRNETYTGTLWQNRWRREMVAGKPGQKPKRRVYERPREEQICTPVPAIIPKETFNVVQTRLVENKRWAARNTKREYLLSGLLKHACGSSMGARTSHGTPYYYCLKSNRFKAPIDEKGEPQPCPCTWVNGRAMETAVWDTVTGLLRHPDLLMQELERLTQPDSATREALEEELAQVKKRLEELPREERRLVEGYRKGFYVDFMMREEMERVRSEQTSAEQRRRELERQLAHLDRALSYKGQVEQLASRLSEGLDQMGFAERRELLRLLVDEAVYNDGRVTIKTIIPFGNSADEVQLYPVPQGGQGDGRRSPSNGLARNLVDYIGTHNIESGQVS